MLNTPDIKQYIVEKFGGNESDWKRTNKTSTTFDDVKFIIRDFINTKTQFGISVINDEDSENGSIEDAKIYIDEKDWIFKIWVECDDLTNIGKESLSDVNYSIIFYEKDNDGDFDWHVGEYLHGFRLLSKDYEEVSENEFSYSGNSLLTLDDVKNDLIKPIMFNGKIHINGFIFDGFFN